jgi:hypothetical protein
VEKSQSTSKICTKIEKEETHAHRKRTRGGKEETCTPEKNYKRSK